MLRTAKALSQTIIRRISSEKLYIGSSSNLHHHRRRYYDSIERERRRVTSTTITTISSNDRNNNHNNRRRRRRRSGRNSINRRTLVVMSHSNSNNNKREEEEKSESFSLSTDTFFLDEFAQRQWDDPDYSGTIIDFNKREFVQKIHDYHTTAQNYPLVDGYAPFCKHVFVPNFVDAKISTVKITKENEHLMKSGYSSRSANELAVLTRWFTTKDVKEVKTSKMLDIILYSREQLVKEREATGKTNINTPLPNAPWGIISIKAQDEAFELPMQPITMMRNALGKTEGGSGVPLDKSKYDASVEYWRNHAPLLKTETPNGD
jgi:hypothetical protein